MNSTERLAQNIRCTSVDDARSTLKLMLATAENIAAMKLCLNQLDYQGFQKTKAGLVRGWLKRAQKNPLAIQALSIRQPWAWLILKAGKDIENRTWKTSFRGRVLIHAASGMTRKEFDQAMEWIALSQIPLMFSEPDPNALLRGGIIGSVEIVDCVTYHHSPWFQGPYGFVLRDPQPVVFRPCKGTTFFFKPKLPQLLEPAQ